MDYEALSMLRRELARSPELWQFDLLDAGRLCQFSKDRNVYVFGPDTVEQLWQVGLLRADLIVSETEIVQPFLEPISQEGGRFSYFDARPVPHLPHGYGGAFPKKGRGLEVPELYFHPFRIYVLYHVDRVFQANISSTQYLQNPDGLINLSKHVIESLNQWTADAQCAECFERWNRRAELAIVLEPSAYRAVFHMVRWRWPDSQETAERKLNEHHERVGGLLSTATVPEINELRTSLCQDAELLDRNKLIHVLLRLMSAQERLKLRSALGACMLFYSMAEIIRRATEKHTSQQLPEEDEIGFGQWMDGARKLLYGSERIFGASRETRREFLNGMGLDYGIKIRCYIEGDTEYGALASAVGDAGGVEFINLRGQVIERRGKGLSFAASLKNDMKANIFSLAILDSDRTDYVRALRKAAKDGSFFGSFFISSPDIEFANFTGSELVEVLLSLAGRDVDALSAREELEKLVVGVTSGRQFFDRLKRSNLGHIQKGESWGEALMRYAINHPDLSPAHREAGAQRPILEAARLILRARRSGYLYSQGRLTVDPDTGRLSEKAGASTDDTRQVSEPTE